MRTKRLFFKRYISYRKKQESRFVCANNTQNQIFLSAFYLAFQRLSITETKRNKSEFLIIFFKLEFIQVTYNI